MSNIDDTLKERGKRHGLFSDHARVTQAIKDVMRNTSGWQQLSDMQKESLEMNAHKVGRILCGDPNFKDHWHDIVGYAKLVDDSLQD